MAGIALLLGALAFSFAPASSGGSECGWWGSPEWGEAESKDLARRALETPGGEGIAFSTARAYRECNEKLVARRNVSLGLLAVALLLPAGIVYVGRSRDQVATP